MVEQGKSLRPSGPWYAVKHRDGHYAQADSLRSHASSAKDYWAKVTGASWATLHREGWRIVKVRIVPFEEDRAALSAAGGRG